MLETSCTCTRMDANLARDHYLLVSVDGNWCNICKFAGSQLRRSSYRVQQSECYMLPMWTTPTIPHMHRGSCDDSLCDEGDSEGPPIAPPDPPHIPLILSTPAEHVLPPSPPPAVLPSMLDHPCDSHVQRHGVDSTATMSPPMRRSGHLRSPPKHLDDYVLDG